MPGKELLTDAWLLVKIIGQEGRVPENERSGAIEEQGIKECDALASKAETECCFVRA